jgi:hypothetical protein
MIPGRPREAESTLAAEPRLGRRLRSPQAVENALKAFLVWPDAPFAETHGLGTLGAIAVQFEATLESLVDRLSDAYTEPPLVITAVLERADVEFPP